MMTRRNLLQTGAVAALAGADFGLSPDIAGSSPTGVPLSPGVPAGLDGVAVMEALPGKQKLIKLSYRPPNYEAPLQYFSTPITPNDRFYVRYHFSDIPKLDAKIYKIAIGGDGASGRTEITFNDLKKFPVHEVVAVNHCSGNRRGLSTPHVPGVQWGYGAMGCARWKGVRLRDLLDKVGVKKDAIEVAFKGADGPAYEKTPNYVKSLPLWRAMDDSTLVAYEMNGEPLPHLNGYPARLVVPGWTSTYWMKHLTGISVLLSPEQNFWMKSRYRIPLGKFPGLARFVSQEDAATTAITEMVVNSLITSHIDGDRVTPGKVTLRGLAWDGGHGIRTVEGSIDGGKTWVAAKLGDDLGVYAFRPWSFDFPAKRGQNTVTIKATNMLGQTQPASLIFNPAGYHNNVMQSLTLIAA